MCGYDIEGQWYPRVTKIVEIKAKPALYRFYAEAANFAEGEEIKQKSASEGTLIHETVEKILLGERPEVSPLISPAIAALQEFLFNRGIQVDPEFVEHRVKSDEHRYAGTIDALAWIDGKFGVLDIKTSYAIFRDYNLQTSAYLCALRSQLPNLSTRWILRIDQAYTCLVCGATLRPKGGRNKIRVNKHAIACSDDAHQWGELKGDIELQEFPYFQQDFKAFLGAKVLWEWENDYWLRRIGYL